MRTNLHRTLVILGTMLLALGLVSLTAPGASATSVYTCSGSPGSPGVLPTVNGPAQISGFCQVSGGPTTINGTLTLLPGSGLLAAFTHSPLHVNAAMYVQSGATLILGCDPNEFPCMDDPSRIGTASVNGGLFSSNPLGVVTHHATIIGNVSQSGGGGGTTCNPSGIFTAFQSPVFSTYELGTINGSLTISGYNSCWLGVEDMHVTNNVSITNNQLADPDAIEITADHISGNLSCSGNSMTWDNNDGPSGNLYPRVPNNPNVVAGRRSGQCLLSSPFTPGGPYGPGPF